MKKAQEGNYDVNGHDNCKDETDGTAQIEQTCANSMESVKELLRQSNLNDDESHVVSKQ